MDFDLVHRLTKEARPVDYYMLLSYILKAPNERYVRNVMLPSLRRLHKTIWTQVDSKRMQ